MVNVVVIHVTVQKNNIGQNFAISKASFKCHSSHEPNLMLMNENDNFCSVTFGSTQVRIIAWFVSRLECLLTCLTTWQPILPPPR